jgi:lipopolysaccharide/colanic/teichoic acid biosynthesis glycosyltransferase
MKAPSDHKNNSGSKNVVNNGIEPPFEKIETIEPFYTRKMPIWKRVIDIVGALIALIIFAPLFLITSIIIKLVSPGPVFFRQKRIGYRGRPFKIWKFRTMEVNADNSEHKKLVKHLVNNSEPMSKLEQDPQIIPFGRVIRNCCIDELPQLINVLLGEMSLVGPRPDVEYSVSQYEQWHSGRFSAVPGMTGLWQVSGKNRTTFNKMVSLDINYDRKRSVWNDFIIILKTIPSIIKEAKSTYYSNKSDHSESRNF